MRVHTCTRIMRTFNTLTRACAEWGMRRDRRSDRGVWVQRLCIGLHNFSGDAWLTLQIRLCDDDLQQNLVSQYLSKLTDPAGEAFVAVLVRKITAQQRDGCAPVVKRHQ